MYKVGITGGIGSGKSTVCQLLEQYGAKVYDSDVRAKQLMNSDPQIRERLTQAFGETCYNAEGLDRKYLASRVFGDEEQLQRLNSIVHPAVKADFRSWAESQDAPYVILESAILFQAGFEDVVDTTLAVMAPVEERIRRAMERDGAEREAVESRINHQMSDEELSSRADRCIVNLIMDYLESDVEQLHKIYIRESTR